MYDFASYRSCRLLACWVLKMDAFFNASSRPHLICNRNTNSSLRCRYYSILLGYYCQNNYSRARVCVAYVRCKVALRALWKSCFSDKEGVKQNSRRADSSVRCSGRQSAVAVVPLPVDIVCVRCVRWVGAVVYSCCGDLKGMLSRTVCD